jgi:very-short-patch-repair endonuclease
MRRPLKRTLVKLYRGKDPYRWLSIADIAKRYGVSTRVVKEWLAFYGIPIRNSKENFKKAKACMRRGDDPRHFSGPELRARRVLESLGYFRGSHWRHNFQVGTASVDFYFPREKFALEIDSAWHDASWWRNGTLKRAEADARRDGKLIANGVRVARVRWYCDEGAEIAIRLAMNQIRGGVT